MNPPEQPTLSEIKTEKEHKIDSFFRHDLWRRYRGCADSSPASE